MALRDVMQHVVDVQKEMAKPAGDTQSSARRWTLALVCIALLALSVYSWVARPEFIWGPRPQLGSPQRQVANARTVVFLLSRRIEAYRTAKGRYPANLGQLGVSERVDGLTYTLLSNGLYRLSAHAAGGDVTYQSDQPADGFVGNSLRVLGGEKAAGGGGGGGAKR